MLSGTREVTCPVCGTPALLTMYTGRVAEDTDRFDFELSCPDGHQITKQPALDLWIAAMRSAPQRPRRRSR